MLRIALLALLLTGLLASSASAARTINASVWSGKLIVVTDHKVQDERHEEGHDNVRHASGRTVMSGRVRQLVLPARSGERSSWLGGGGSLQQLQGSVDSTYLDVDAFRTIDVACHGDLAQNNGTRSIQFRTSIGYSGALKLELDGLSLLPEESCNREGFESPIHLDGWPEDYVFGLPAAPHTSRTLSLQSDWWHFYSTCGLGEEREGSGAPPGVVQETDNGELCISGHVTRIHTLLDLKRTCARYVMKTTRSSADGRCVRR